MIKLRKTEQIDVFQLELTLKVKTKQSPFIAILILASELGAITPSELQDKLLPVLPLRACSNLLERLKQQGYLDYNWDTYELTEFGKQSAADESFWIGEKGVYNVYTTSSNLISQRVINIQKSERAYYDQNGNRSIPIPDVISDARNRTLSFINADTIIEEIEKNCFQQASTDYILEVEAEGDRTCYRIRLGKKILFEQYVTYREEAIRGDILSASTHLDYDSLRNVALTTIDPGDLTFLRKVRIEAPIFEYTQFDPIEIENVPFIPLDKEHAVLWLDELLFASISQYYLDDQAFAAFAEMKAAPIKAHYSIQVPGRKELIQSWRNRENAFYRIAKLDTIDHLNY